jgi:hypothetical protein
LAVQSVGFCRSISTGILRRRLGLNPSLIDAGAFPKLARDLNGIDASLLPPGFFVTGAMHRAVMRAAEGDREFIARFAAERARLHKSDVMRVRGLAATQQAWLLHHEAKVVPVAIAARRFGQIVQFRLSVQAICSPDSGTATLVVRDYPVG